MNYHHILLHHTDNIQFLPAGCHSCRPTNSVKVLKAKITDKLEGCIDDERQFKTAKRSQAPGDATVLKRFFRDNFVIFRRKSKRIAFLESVNFSMCVYMQVFNFRAVA